MPPTRAIDNAAYVAALYAQGIGNRLVRRASSTAPADLSHESIRHGRCVMALAFLLSVCAHVCIVLGRRSPSEITQAIIAGIAVYVQRLHAVRSRPDESQQHEAVDVKRAAFSAKGHDAAAIRIVDARAKRSPFVADAPFASMASPYAAVISRSVTRVAGNIFECSHLYVLSHMDRMRNISCVF